MESVQSVIFALAVLFACHEILSVQGRQLRPMNKQESFNNKNIEALNSGAETTEKVSQTISSSNDNAGGQKASFQLSPSENVSLHHQVPNYGFGHGDSAQVHIDAIRPTTPGKSPGIGHSFANDNGLVEENSANDGRHFITGNKDDFRPTSPGHSPGVGHAIGKNATTNA